MAKRSKMIPAEELDPRFVRVVHAFAGTRGVKVERGFGQGHLALKVSAKIFAMLMEAGLVAKLPRARVDELVGAGEGARFDPRRNGQLMKEWLVVPREELWVALAREAHAFVAGEKKGTARPSRGSARAGE